MKITRTSDLTGTTHTMELPVTQVELDRCWKFNAKREGEHIQDVFPHLRPDQREFLISGVTAEEWEQAFPPEDDD